MGSPGLLTSLAHASPWLLPVMGVAVAFLVIAVLACLVRQARQRSRNAEQMRDRLAERDRFWELSPDMMCVADFDGVILRVNPTLERTMGYRTDELVGRKFMELVHPDDVANTLADLTEAAEGRRVFESINRFQHKNGSYLHLTWNSQPIVAERRFYAVGHDVTDRILAEEKARAQDARLDHLSRLYRTILDASEYSIVTVNPDGLITTYNKGAERIFGYAAEEMIDKATPELWHVPGDMDAEADRLSQIVGRPVKPGMEMFRVASELEQPYEREWRYRRKDGTEFPGFLSLTLMRGGVGQFIGMLGIVRDVTEDKRREEELRASLQKFRTLTEQAPVGIFLTDPSGRNVYVNEHYTRQSGLTYEQAMGEGWKRSIHPDDLQRLAVEWPAAVERGERYHTEFRFRTPAGLDREMAATATPLHDADGRLTGHLGTIVDITEEKAARHLLERRVRERTVELTETNRRLEHEAAVRRSAERKAAQHRDQLMHVARVSTMGELAAGLAHELNQPLGAIVNYTQGCARLIESGTTDHRRLIDTLAKVTDQAHRAGQIIHRLRAFVAKGETTRGRVAVAPMVHEVAELLEADKNYGAVEVAFDVADDLPAIYADRIQVQQVLLNLMRNGVEAMVNADSPVKRLTVTAEVCDDAHAVRVAVSDTGPGCSDAQLARLFDPFFTTKSDGMGMGLSISRTIIESHGGRLNARRNPDGGLTFAFTLDVDGDTTDGQSPQSDPTP